MDDRLNQVEGNIHKYNSFMGGHINEKQGKLSN